MVEVLPQKRSQIILGSICHVRWPGRNWWQRSNWTQIAWTNLARYLHGVKLNFKFDFRCDFSGSTLGLYLHSNRFDASWSSCIHHFLPPSGVLKPFITTASLGRHTLNGHNFGNTHLRKCPRPVTLTSSLVIGAPHTTCVSAGKMEKCRVDIHRGASCWAAENATIKKRGWPRLTLHALRVTRLTLLIECQGFIFVYSRAAVLEIKNCCQFNPVTASGY